MSADALAQRVLDAATGALELYSIHIGCQLGLYAALWAQGPLTADDLAAAAAADPAYVESWVHQQVVAGFLVEDGTHRHYLLPPEHAAVLADPESRTYMAAFAPLVVAIARGLPDAAGVRPTGARARGSGADPRRSHRGEPRVAEDAGTPVDHGTQVL